MWVVILCFVLPVLLFSLCALLAWLRVLHVNRTREKTECADVFVNDELMGEKKTICNIPIRVFDVDTGNTFIYSADEETQHLED